MDKRKKQKKKAASAVPPPQKKIKKAQKNKGKIPVTNAAPPAPSEVTPSTPPSVIPTPSVPAKDPSAKDPPAKRNGATAVVVKGNKEDSGQQHAGYIFFCNGRTKAECYQNSVFGLPRGKLDEVQKIKKGAKLFLYDYDLKLLYGVYKAASDGGLNLEADAFNGNFPAQVKFKVFKDCYPLPETTLKQAIMVNYNNKGRFNPELSSEQVKGMLSLFQPIRNKPQSAVPRGREERRGFHPEERPIRRGVAYAQDDRHFAPVTHVQRDPYASGHRTRPPPMMDLHDPYTYPAHATRTPLLLDQHVQNDYYGSAAHVRRAPAARSPPPADAYYPGGFGFPPSDVYHPTVSVQTNSQAYYPQTSVVERYRAIPQIMLPNEHPTASARDYRFINARDSEVAPRMGLANHGTGRADEGSNRAYADGHHRPVSSRANVSNLPVSSLYSFAGAAPAYR